jgi:hypothetical protein
MFAVRRKQYVAEENARQRLHSSWDWTEDKPISPDGPDWLLPFLGERIYREMFVRAFGAEASGNELNDIPNLRCLHALTAGQISKDQLELLASLSELEVINLAGPWDKVERAVEIPTLPRLRALSFDEPVDFLDWHLHQTPGLPGLNRKIDRLKLPQSKINDTTLRSIGRIKTLVSLRLFDADVTDAGLESLVELHDLRELRLDNTLVTAEGIRRLHDALPKCRIELWPRPRDEND